MEDSVQGYWLFFLSKEFYDHKTDGDLSAFRGGLFVKGWKSCERWVYPLTPVLNHRELVNCFDKHHHTLQYSTLRQILSHTLYIYRLINGQQKSKNVSPRVWLSPGLIHLSISVEKQSSHATERNGKKRLVGSRMTEKVDLGLPCSPGQVIMQVLGGHTSTRALNHTWRQQGVSDLTTEAAPCLSLDQSSSKKQQGRVH